MKLFHSASWLKTCAVLSLAALAAWADDPAVSDVSLSLLDGGRLRGAYSLTNGPAIVTVSFATNGAALPDAVSQFLDGDVNKIVTNASCSFTWDYLHACPGLKTDGANLTATVTASTLLDPPQYCVVDLSRGTNSASYPLAFYVSSNAVPGGITANEYKTWKILLRKILRTGSTGFTMGTPVTESPATRNAAREKQHKVVLTHDYYIGVYEITQEQWRRVFGTSPFGFSANEYAGFWYCPERPAEMVRYSEIRGSRDEGINWPSTTNAVSAASFLGLLRAKTGNALVFDLPTEAQWEYACRAGTTGAWNNGTDITNNTRDANADLLGRYRQAQGNVIPALGGTARVGNYLPNAWGLYDMHGNVLEWCADWLLDGSLSDATNPVGPVENQTYRSARGGCWYHGSCDLRSGRRNSWEDNKQYNSFGFRLSATLGAAWNGTVQE